MSFNQPRSRITRRDIIIPHPEATEIEKMRQYFKNKFENGTDPLINTIRNRTRENILKIFMSLLECMREDNRNGKVFFKYIPSGISFGGKSMSPTLTDIFYREKSEYEKYPEILLRDLDIYSEYYGNHSDGANMSSSATYTQPDPKLEKAIRIGIDSIPNHPLYGKPKMNEFGLNNQGIVTYIGKGGQRGIDYSEIIHRIQINYEDIVSLGL